MITALLTRWQLRVYVMVIEKYALPVQENNFHVHVFSIFVEEILQKMRYRLVGDVSTHNNMPKFHKTELVEGRVKEDCVVARNNHAWRMKRTQNYSVQQLDEIAIRRTSTNYS